MSIVRLYFNEHGEVPWSVDRGGPETEQTVRAVSFSGQGRTVYRPGHIPCAWLEFEGYELKVKRGLAVIKKVYEEVA